MSILGKTIEHNERKMNKAEKLALIDRVGLPDLHGERITDFLTPEEYQTLNLEEIKGMNTRQVVAYFRGHDIKEKNVEDISSETAKPIEVLNSSISPITNESKIVKAISKFKLTDVSYDINKAIPTKVNALQMRKIDRLKLELRDNNIKSSMSEIIYFALDEFIKKYDL